MKEDFNSAINILKKIVNHKDASDLFFQLLGNSYDLQGKSSDAFKAYDEGLEKFPNSGIINLIKGNAFGNIKDYDNALVQYENSINVDPEFPSNYYRAAILYCNSSEEIWGMMYGEIFINLEPNTKRTTEISKLLYDTYKSEINFIGDTSVTVSFSKNISINADDLADPANFKLPFPMIYEQTLLMAAISEETINLNTLNKIRTKYLNLYYENEHNLTHPNTLFNYKKKVEEAGHLEAYNYFILHNGDVELFERWMATNSEKWDKFENWFMKNRMIVNNSNKNF